MNNVENELRRLADFQLVWLYRAGKFHSEIKSEWKRRWALEFPKWKNAKGEIIEEAII